MNKQWYPIRIFLHKPYAGNTEGGINVIKDCNFEFKKKKKKKKKVRIWSFLNVEGNNLLIDIHRHKLM